MAKQRKSKQCVLMHISQITTPKEVQCIFVKGWLANIISWKEVWSNASVIMVWSLTALERGGFM